MAIRAPWKGWIRIALPIVSFLILALTFIVTVIAILNAASIDLSHHDHDNDTARYIRTHAVQVRSQLVFFWATIPFVLLVVTTCELVSLWNDRLRPLWVLISSCTACGLWTMQLILWSLCLSHRDLDYCPSVYYEDSGSEYTSWNTISPWSAAYIIPLLFLGYATQIALSSLTLHRLSKSSFRKSDLRGSWALKQEIAVSQSTIASESETRRMLAANDHHNEDIPISTASPSLQHHQPDSSPAMAYLPDRVVSQDRQRKNSSVRSGRSSELGSGRSTFTAFSGTWAAAAAMTMTTTTTTVAGSPCSAETTFEEDEGLMSPIQIDISSYDDDNVIVEEEEERRRHGLGLGLGRGLGGGDEWV